MGNETDRSRRLWPAALRRVRLRAADDRRCLGTAIDLRPDRYAPVNDCGFAAISAGLPSAPRPARRGRPPWAHVDHVIGGANRVLVVLDHQHRVAEIAQAHQRPEQPLVVALVQPDGRLVEDVKHAHQRAADLRGQANALRFAARQGRRRAVERQVVHADVDQERQPIAHLAQDPAGDLLLPGRAKARQEDVGVADGQRRHLDDVLAAHPHVARLLAQPRAPAFLARGLRHVPVKLVVDRLEVLVGRSPLLAPPPLVLVEPPLQVREHALEFLLVGVLAAVLLEREVHLLAGRAVQHQAARGLGQLVPGHVQIDLEVGRHRLEELLEEGAVAPLPGLDRALLQRQILVGDDELGIEEHLGADAVAGRTGARGVVEREQPRLDLRIADAAGGAGELLGEGQIVPLERRDLHHAAGQLRGQLDRVGQPLLDAVLADQAVDEHLDGVLLVLVELGGLAELDQIAVDVGAHEAVLAQLERAPARTRPCDRARWGPAPRSRAPRAAPAPGRPSAESSAS
jgi:hypothetical protein